MSSIVIFSELGEVKIVNEPNYTFGSQDNVQRYAQEENLQPAYMPTSTHGIFLNGDPVVVFGAPGGCSAVHEHSALVLNSKLFLAVGGRVVCISLNDLKLTWASVVDGATCFGIYYEPKRRALISHGELDVVRLDEMGRYRGAVLAQIYFWKALGLKKNISWWPISINGTIALTTKMAYQVEVRMSAKGRQRCIGAHCDVFATATWYVGATGR